MVINLRTGGFVRAKAVQLWGKAILCKKKNQHVQSPYCREKSEVLEKALEKVKESEGSRLRTRRKSGVR